MKNVVVIGGGSGLSTLLRGLRDYPLNITAIVTMTDDGASTGRLRKDFNILPPGDIRRCIAALSDNETGLNELFQYRFKKGLGISGHSLGNLLITAMKDLTGNFELAIEEISKILNIRGQVLPATLEDVNLRATFVNGKEIIGESKITRYGYLHKIKQLALTHKAKTNQKALDAIKGADVIFIGPGSLYTSVIPNFLQEKMLGVISSSHALKVYICNVSTERGETDNFSVQDHLYTLEKYKVPIDVVLLNNHKFPKGSGDGFVAPVREGKEVFTQTKIYADVVDVDNPLYHDSIKLGDAAWKIISDLKRIKKIAGEGNIYEI